MAEDRFVTQTASRVAFLVIDFIRKAGFLFKQPEPVKRVTAPVVQPLLLRVREAGVVLARTEPAIRGLIRRGELKTVRHGRSVRIPYAEITNFVERDSVRRKEKR